ncbi:restriction endonuclease subunit S [Escherichia coli]|uniref:restriction endonuclease subunit S n=1 Tax=Escherichia coli TaxID=562 RepID=UPI0007BBCFEC|nr:restriction endonuclease subunit S [Escherichia coli]EEW2009089.1 restriction endonuclease subunit S [Escherichia coli]EFE6913465.1 restriction endonuclease subunit S [Escherichia coli]EFM2183492.1 restriction endonuclease subunit S [Escherichia coli]EHB6034673.1 restriction endonuclease subunit S [Escherichia coli]KZO81744.1 restriction endonuclease subunit S [Escherichia coli]
MSELSYLEKLLDGVEVEWLPLSGLARIRNGKDHKSLSEGEFPVYGSGGIMRYVDTYAYNKPSVLIPRKGSLGNLFFVNVPFWTVDTIFYTEIDEAQIRPKYLYYFLTTVGLGEMNQAGGVPSQTQSVLNKLKIPIPCPDNPEKSLAIQSEIVRILDKFTALTAELTAELNMRKKQYNYYRDQLLNLEGRENTREMRIGDIYDFQYGTGNTIPKSGGQYPVYGSNGIVGSHDKYNSEDSPVIGHIGAYAGIVNWGQGKHFVTYNGVICRHKSKEVLQKYAYYLLLLQDFGSKSNSASQPFVSYNILNAPIVLVPPLQEQARIVAILDKFDTLTNSITEGLPREIELRQKQYEYYRDLLFSFPKPETVSN